MKRALVTGATGMLGSYIVRELLAKGCSVRALVRDASAARWLQLLGVELVVGDLGNCRTIHHCADDCDAVFHAAAAIGPQTEWESFRSGNVDGTRRIIDACAETGSRLVLVSSTAVYGDLRYERPSVDKDH